MPKTPSAVQSRKYRLKDPRRNLVSRAKRRSQSKRIVFDLEAEDITIPKRCPVLGIPLRPEDPSNSPHLPSLDRLVPSKGYVKSNVRVISLRANKLKNDARLEELEAVVRYVRSELGRH